MKKGKFVEFISALLIFLFLYAAFSKLFNREELHSDMYNQPIPRWLSFLLVWTLPPSEIAIACCLLFERTRRLGLFAAAGLLSVFTLYIAAILLHFFSWTPCSCGGVFKKLGWQEQLLVNLGFIVLTVLGILAVTKERARRGNTIIHH